MAEPIEMQFGPKEPCIRWGPDSHVKGKFEGKWVAKL